MQTIVVRSIFLVLAGLAISCAFPADELMIESPIGDTAVVESKIREVRAAPDDDDEHTHEKIKAVLDAGGVGAYVHKFGNGDGDAHGFHRKSAEKGSDGYKHFDSFHKKDSDKYGYEKHSELGENGKYTDEVTEDKPKKSAKLQKKEEDDEEDGAETKQSYKVVEEVDEDDGSSYYEGGGDGGEQAEAESGEYASDGDSGHYTEVSSDGDHENYDGGASGEHHSDADSNSYSNSDGDSGHYAKGGSSGNSYSSGGSYSQGGDESSGEHYSHAAEGGDDGGSEHYSEDADEDEE